MGAIGNISTNITTYATHGATSAWLWAENFLALVILAVIMIGFSYRSGRGGIVSLIVAFYGGYALYSVFPYTNSIIATGGTPLIKAIISIIIFGIATYIPFHFIQRLVGGGFGVLSFVPRFALSFLSAAFLMALAYHVFHVNNIYTLPDSINHLFAPNGYFFWWFVAPLIGLIFFVH